MRPLLHLARPLAAPIVVLGAVELVLGLERSTLSYAAAPSAILAALLRLLREGALVKHAAISVGRLLAGTGIGALVGTVTGLLLAESRLLDQYLSPTVRFVAGVPIVLWMPVCILLFGTDEGFKLSLLAISTGLLFHLYVFQAITSTEKRYMELALLFEKSFWERTRLVLVPAACGALFSALRTSLTFGWVLLFFLEFAAARQGVEGLGWFVANERQLGRVEDEYAGLLLLGGIAWTVDVLVLRVESRLMVWSDRWARP